MNHDLFEKTFICRLHVQICAYACLVNETQCSHNKGFFLINFHIVLCFFFLLLFFYSSTFLSLGFWLKTLYVGYRPCDIISTWQLAPVSFIVYMFITWVRRTAKTIFKMQQKQQRKNILCSLVVSGGLWCVFVCLFPAFHHRSAVLSLLPWLPWWHLRISCQPHTLQTYLFG